MPLGQVIRVLSSITILGMDMCSSLSEAHLIIFRSQVAGKCDFPSTAAEPKKRWSWAAGKSSTLQESLSEYSPLCNPTVLTGQNTSDRWEGREQRGLSPTNTLRESWGETCGQNGYTEKMTGQRRVEKVLVHVGGIKLPLQSPGWVRLYNITLKSQS